MRAQIGEIVAWVTKGIAILILVGTFAFIANERFANLDTQTNWEVIAGGCAVAAITFLIGKIVRYVLASA